MSKWISVKDRMPLGVTDALVYGQCCESHNNIEIAFFEDGEWALTGSGECLTFKPTHWMPLPEIPNINE